MHKLLCGILAASAAFMSASSNSSSVESVAQSQATVKWRTVASSPIKRSEAAGVASYGKLYVFGGYTDTSYYPTRRSDAYDAASNSWTRIANLPKPLTHAGTAVEGDNIYIAGGYEGQPDGTGQIFATKNVWKYNTGTNTWTAMPPLPAARGSGELSVLGQTLHFFGGTNIQRTQDKGEHWILPLNGKTKKWTAAAPLPNPRTHMGDAVIGGKIYAVGGQHGHDQNLVTQASVHRWDPATNTWTKVKDLPQARSHISGATLVLDGRIVVVGGEIAHNKSVSTVTMYDPLSNSWTALTPLLAARYSGVAGEIGDQIYYTTGSPGFKTTTFKGVPANLNKSQTSSADASLKKVPRL